MEEDLGPRLRQAGVTLVQCRALAQTCAKVSEQQGGGDVPSRLLLSKDNATVAWLDGQGRLRELQVDKALAPPAPSTGMEAKAPNGHAREPVDGAELHSGPSLLAKEPAMEGATRSR
jgi:hypothetical protein